MITEHSPAVEGALYAAAALIGTLLLMLIVLLLTVMVVSARLRSLRADSAALRPRLHTALIEFLGGTSTADSFHGYLRKHRADLVDAIRLFQSTVGGSARDRLCSLALDLGLVAEWCANARSRKLARRRAAFLNLSFASAYEPCRQLAGDRLIGGLTDADEEVRLYACRGLLAAGEGQHVETIFALALGPNLLTRIVLTEDLRRYATQLAAGPARAALRSGETGQVRAALEILVAWERAIALEDIRDFLEHSDREVRILAFRMAGFTTVNSQSRLSLVRSMHDPDLAIRALAIIAVGRQKMTEAIPELARCLRREALEEARLAAAALAGMPPLGWRTLEELSASQNPPTALAAREALAHAKELRVMLTIVLALLLAALAALAATGFDALLKGYFELRRNLQAVSDEFGNILLKTPTVPGVSVIVTATDASAAALALVRRLLNLHYGNHEVVLVLCALGATDLRTWIEELRLVPQDRGWLPLVPAAEVMGAYVSLDPVRLMVVHTVSGGRAGAMNAGVNAAQYPVIGLIDLDADFIPELLLRLIRPMLGDWGRTVAVSGVAPPDAPAGLVSGIATLEALGIWLARCAGASASNHLLPTPGACLLVKRDALIQVGGFRAGPVELFLDLHAASTTGKLAWRFALVASPVSHRPVATTWGKVMRQTGADQRALGTALGFFPTGAATKFAGLYCDRVLRPLLETAALTAAFAGWYTGAVPAPLVLLAPLVSIGGGMVNSMAAVVLREAAQPGATGAVRLATLFLTSIPENLGYRQLRNLLLVARYFG